MGPEGKRLQPHRVIAHHSQLPPCWPGNLPGPYFAFKFLEWRTPGWRMSPQAVFICLSLTPTVFGVIPTSFCLQTYRGCSPAVFVLKIFPDSSPGWFWGRETIVWVSFLLWWELEVYFNVPILTGFLFLFHECNIFSFSFEMIHYSLYSLFKLFSSFWHCFHVFQVSYFWFVCLF